MTFVGRDRELALLVERVKLAAEGRHSRVLVTGPAGIGSTRLLDGLVQRMAGLSGVVVCRGRAVEPAAALPYQALGDALAAALDLVPDKGLARIGVGVGHDLCGVVADLDLRLERLGIDHAPPALVAPDQVGRRVVESLMTALERLAQTGVVLLILEDVHWADPATRGFIGALVAAVRPHPVCLVVSCQPDELHRRHPARPLFERLRRDANVVRLELAPLSGSEIGRMVEARTESRPVGNVLAAVIEGADGNPLVATQLMAANDHVEGVRLSDPFEQLCGARLEALARDAAGVVRVLATARQPIDRQRLLHMRTPEGRLSVSGLEAAIEAGLVAGSRGQVAVAHELYAEAVEELESPPERHALHSALAAEMDALPAVAAWHWARAARPNEARQAHLRAAIAATPLDPAETTQLHYQQALELPLSEGADAGQRTALLVGSARSAAASGSFRRAVALMRRAIESRASQARSARDADTRRALGEMHEELARFLWSGGDPEAGIATLGKALQLLPPEPTRGRARALATLASQLMVEGRFGDSAGIAEEARRIASAAAQGGDDTRAELGHATCTLGIDVAYLGELDRGLELLKESADISRDAGRLDDLMRVAANRMTVLDLDARREQALAVVQEGMRDAHVGGMPATYGAMLRGNAADILFHLGRWAEAEMECRAAMEAPPTGAEWLPTLYLALVLVESRADDEAASLVGHAVLEFENVAAGQWTALVLRAAVSLAIWRGHPGEALAIAEQEWPRARATDEVTIITSAASTCLEAAAAASSHGELEHDAGLVARARSLAATVIPIAEHHLAASTLDTNLGARQEAELHMATARAHRSRLRSGAKPERWAEIADAWANRSMPYLCAKARWWQALAVLEASSVGEEPREVAREAARVPLSEAFELSRMLGALPLLREVIDLAARARVTLPVVAEKLVLPVRRDLVAVGPGRRGVAVPIVTDDAASKDGATDLARTIEERVLAALRVVPTDRYGLSPREREVLIVLAEGRTDRDIASRLFISQRTVHVHVRRILAKLGVSSRTEAAGVAIRQGLVPTETGGHPPSGQRVAAGSADDVASGA